MITRELIKTLRTLSDKQFTEVFYEAVEGIGVLETVGETSKSTSGGSDERGSVLRGGPGDASQSRQSTRMIGIPSGLPASVVYKKPPPEGRYAMLSCCSRAVSGISR